MFNAFDPDRTEVTGPYNAIRMEGEIGGRKKVVYMFMDIHMPRNAQTECLNVYSKDINRYLAETFHELNGADRTYDFFLEIYPTEYKVDSILKTELISKQGRSRQHDMYIWQVVDLMKASVNYDAAGDKVGTSEVFKNVRLHYLDIRETLNQIMIGVYVNLNCDMLYGSDLPPTIFQMLERAKGRSQAFVDLYQKLKADPSTATDSTDSADPADLAFAKSIRKLLYGYKHKSIQEAITKHLDRYFGELSELIVMIEDSISVLQNYDAILNDRTITFTRDNNAYPGIDLIGRLKIITNIQEHLFKLHDKATFAGVGITDCYLMRRILDKDYVTNAITYTGFSHTMNYVNILAGDFEFKVTNVSFTRAPSISELNRTIAKRLAAGEYVIDLFTGSKQDQCTDLTDFPKRFM